MTWFGRSTRSPIGIDVGVSHIKAVQLQRVGDQWHAAAAVSIPRAAHTPIEAEELSRFMGLLDRQGFVGKDTVVAVPEQMLISGLFDLPSRDSGAPLDEISQMELARTHKLEPDSFTMATWDVPAAASAAAGTHVMAVACENTKADRILDLFEGTGQNVLALDVAAWSLARACRPLLKTGAGVTAILDLGWGSARLVILYDGVIVYQRDMSESGVQILHAAIADRTGMDPEMIENLLAIQDDPGADDAGLQKFTEVEESYVETLVQELQASFSYASHQYQGAAVHGLILLGGGAGIRRMNQQISDALDFEVQLATLSQLIECVPEMVHYQDSTAMGIALGLAQYGQEEAR